MEAIANILFVIGGCAGAAIIIRKFLKGQLSLFDHMNAWSRASIIKLDKADRILALIFISCFIVGVILGVI